MDDQGNYAYIDQAIEAAIRLQGVDNVDYLFVMSHSHSLNRRCIYHLQGASEDRFLFPAP